MSREHFNLKEEKLYKRLEVIKDLIAEQPCRDSPCPLLLAQLNDLEVLTFKLQSTITELKETLEEENT